MISKHFLELTDIGVVQLLENRDFAHERVLCLAAVGSGLVRGHPSDLALLDHLDREPLAGGARDGLHDGGKRALAKLMADIVKRVYAAMSWASSGVPIDEA